MPNSRCACTEQAAMLRAWQQQQQQQPTVGTQSAATNCGCPARTHALLQQSRQGREWQQCACPLVMGSEVIARFELYVLMQLQGLGVQRVLYSTE